MLAHNPIRSALIISPHADDEVLGCGGLLSKMRKSEVKARVLFLTVDGFHHYGLREETTLHERKEEIARVSSMLGYEYRIVYEGRDLIEKLDTVPTRELVDLFEAEYDEFRPDLLILPHGVDFDQDHVTCFKAAHAAARPIPGELDKHFPGKVATYEMPKLVWSYEPFQPTLYYDISEEISAKLNAIAAYRSQLRDPPHIRSLENTRALAYLRGSEVGVEYAEAFHILRWTEG
jgi:LmbE family N-acetylglucosaminyl deacetylase